MGREFHINSPDDEQEEIQLAAAYLENKIQEIREEGKIVGSDRVAIIAALSISHELLMLRNGSDSGFDLDEFRRRIVAMRKKVNEAILKKDD